jgi:hypothetical protein
MDAVVPLRRLVELAPADNTAADNLRIMEQLAARQQSALPGPAPPRARAAVNAAPGRPKS